MAKAMSAAWTILKTAVGSFIANEALSRGAAIAFYTVTSLAPVLLIVIGVAGLAFGQDAAQDRVVGELRGLMGTQSAELIQSLIASARDQTSGTAATLFGLLMVVATASGIFGEMQAGLNKTWKVKAPELPLAALVRARAASLGLVAALGFLLAVSLAASAGLSAFGAYLGSAFPLAGPLLSVLNTIVSVSLFALLFAAIYKVLPDTPIAWRDVVTGAILTALLFTAGKSLIGWYIGTSAGSSAYGAAGALIVILLWTYYASQIFLLGAEVTKAVSDSRHADSALPGETDQASVSRGLAAHE
jgi:membrane protein